MTQISTILEIFENSQLAETHINSALKATRTNKGKELTVLFNYAETHLYGLDGKLQMRFIDAVYDMFQSGLTSIRVK